MADRKGKNYFFDFQIFANAIFYADICRVGRQNAGRRMKFHSFILFFLLFALLPDLYFSLVLLRGSWWTALLLLPTAAELVCLPLIGTGRKYMDAVRVFSYLTFIFSLPKFLFCLFHILLHHAAGADGIVADLVPYIVGGGVSLLFSVMIFFVTTHLRVKSSELPLKGLPAGFDGVRVCHLSDFHLGSFPRSGEYIRRIVSKVEELEADLILFSGDLVNFETGETVPHLQALSRIKAPLGVISIRGNHDYLLHGPHKGESREREAEKLLEIERQLGWKVLLNSNTIIERNGDRIAVAGVENISSNPFFPKTGGDLKKALEGLPEDIFKILLSHDPTHWRSEVIPSSDIALTLSGHTHGLKVKMAGLHPSSWRLRESGGIYREGDKVLNVSEGLGSAFAFRLGGFPKIDIFTLRRIL